MPDATLLISAEAMLLHEGASGHPERPDRLRAILADLGARPIEGAEWAPARPVDWSILERAHTPEYLERVERARDRIELFDWDTMTSPGSVAAAELSAGAVIDAIDATLDGRASRAFALGRPPGHHAEADRAMGFCFFSNIAVGALHAIERHGLERVLILDWDVHHGNGTQHILESRADALFVSIHQHPLYPGTGWLTETGVDEGAGYTVNIPYPAGSADAEYLDAIDRLVTPLADAYQPQLVLVSAGFDAHAADPLGAMRVTDAGFGAMCARVRSIADRHADGRLVLALEGGYDLAGLASGVRACVEAMGAPPPPPRPSDLAASQDDARGPSREAVAILDQVIRAHAGPWGRALGL